ncbi:MAG TPA: hypothetical protein VEA69_12915 [Tepidisphaeraceae bacterium]|nr:hypothetical protein [Tepidisphaeraceae bacterium]
MSRLSAVAAVGLLLVASVGPSRADGPGAAKVPAAAAAEPAPRFPPVNAHIGTSAEGFDRDGVIVIGGEARAVGPVHLFLSGDPVAVYTGGWRMRPLDPWLRAGPNTLELRARAGGPAYVKLAKGSAAAADDKVTELARAMLPAGKERSGEAKFDPGERPALPAWDELPAGAAGEAEARKHAAELLDRLRDGARRHDGKAFVRTYRAGRDIWEPAAFGPDVRSPVPARVRAVVDDPATAPVAEDRPLEFVVGRRAVLAYVRPAPDPDSVSPVPRPYSLRLRRGESTFLFGPIQCVRIKGEWLIWHVEAR